MTLDRLIDEFLKHKELVRGRAPKTIESYRGVCRMFKEYVSTQKGTAKVGHVTREMIEAWMAHLHERLDRVTIIHRLSVLRELAKYGVRQRVWQTDPCAEIDPPRRPVRLPRPFTARDRDALMRVELGDEDAAIRAILYYGGLRVHEVCGLRYKHVEPPRLYPDGRQDFAALIVHGKGDKERRVSLHPDAYAALETFMLSKAAEDRRKECFLFTHHGGAAWHTKMIQRRVAVWGAAAGVADCTPHRFRHTYATNLIQHGAGLMVVKDSLGHASVATTQMYAAVTSRDRDAAAASLPSFVMRHDSETAAPAAVDSTEASHNPTS